MKKMTALILAMMMVAMLFAGCGAKAPAEQPTVVVGYTIYEPMNYLDENGKLIGYDTELAEAVFSGLGYKVIFQEIDWNAKEIELNAKNIDCIWNGMTITDERLENMSISVPYMQNKQVMVAKKAK